MQNEENSPSINQLDIYDQLAENSWHLILDSIHKLRQEKKTLVEIAKILGVKNRSLISEWINGNREISRSSFANMIKYLDALGYSVHGCEVVKKTDFTKVNKEASTNIDSLKDEIKKLKKENNKLKEKLDTIKEISGKKKKK